MKKVFLDIPNSYKDEEIKKIRDDFTKAVADAFNIPLNMVK